MKKKTKTEAQDSKKLRLSRETVRRLTLNVRSGIRGASHDAGQCYGGNKTK